MYNIKIGLNFFVNQVTTALFFFFLSNWTQINKYRIFDKKKYYIFYYTVLKHNHIIVSILYMYIYIFFRWIYLYSIFYLCIPIVIFFTLYTILYWLQSKWNCALISFKLFYMYLVQTKKTLLKLLMLLKKKELKKVCIKI